jgi:hypothetical protein
MKALLAPLVALALLGIVVAVDWAYYAPRLPPRVAAHIGPSGQADQWADRDEFLSGSLGGLMTIPLIILAIGLLTFLAVRFLPVMLVNLPRKDYWLATPRRRTEAAVVCLAFLLWFLFALGAMVYFGGLHALFVASLDPEGRDGYLTWPAFVGGVLLIVVQLVLLAVRLNDPARAGRGKAGRKRRAAPHDL